MYQYACHVVACSCLIVVCAVLNPIGSAAADAVKEPTIEIGGRAVSGSVTCDATIFGPTALIESCLQGVKVRFELDQEERLRMKLPAIFYGARAVDALAFTLDRLGLGLSVDGEVAIVSANRSDSILKVYLDSRTYESDSRRIHLYLATRPRHRGQSLDDLLSRAAFGGKDADYPSMIVDIRTSKCSHLYDIPWVMHRNGETIGEILSHSLAASQCRFEVLGNRIQILSLDSESPAVSGPNKRSRGRSESAD